MHNNNNIINYIDKKIVYNVSFTLVKFILTIMHILMHAYTYKLYIELYIILNTNFIIWTNFNLKLLFII